jgi:selenocysteine lyase/cysteine desulfurase
MVDAAQTAGFVPIDMQKDNVDILVFTGHKDLYGPPGIGGLCIKGDIKIDSLYQGGTGSKSEMDVHPEFYPDRLEAGTPNTLGIVGLKAGLQFVINKGIENIRKELLQLTVFFIDKIKQVDNVTLYGPDANDERVSLISLNIRGSSPSEIALMLDREYGIMVRAGLHCSPLAHKAIGTYPQGAVRFSLGCFTTEEEIIYTVNALKQYLTLNKKNENP